MGVFNDKFKEGQWDVFEFITSVYFGKQYYFAESDGRIYSRYSQKYMNFGEALNEFCSFISE